MNSKNWGILRISSLFCIGLSLQAWAAPNPKLQPDAKWEEEIPPIYREVSVVQKRTMTKGGRFLMSPYFSMDFSDSPFSQYGMNIDLGYALSDSWEIYVHSVPLYVTKLRSYVQEIDGGQDAQGNTFVVNVSEPKREFGASILWALAYGKDSLGANSLIRSDTFFRLSASMIQYVSTTGMNYGLGFGKTLFFSHNFGLRATLQGSYLQTPGLAGEKRYRTGLAIEMGAMLYL